MVKFSQNFINEGLRGRPITRDIDWGIPVPLEGWEGKRLYVWFEAVMGYLTASIEWAKNIGSRTPGRTGGTTPKPRFTTSSARTTSPSTPSSGRRNCSASTAFISQPRQQELPDPHIQLPYDVPANEFMNIEGKQFSKSRNWAIWVPDILERYQADAVRYYVAATFPETHDSDFAWDGFLNRVNGELLAAWGNLVNRMLSFAYKRFDGKVPEYAALTLDDINIINRVELGFGEVGR